ncbi:MAG: gephyrin-like molybdotransferase Glp [Candidatus Velthaea sp.]
MRITQALPPGATFVAEQLLAPQHAVIAYCAAVAPHPPGVEAVPLAEAHGRVLAYDAVAAEPFPADARSTMDGFAVRARDGSVPRRIAGEVRMGRPPPAALGPGEAMRIPTGGVLPAGADAVVPVEDALAEGDRLVIAEAVDSGAYVTPRGADITAGDCVIGGGRRIGAPELSVLATLGCSSVMVYRRPRFAIVSTGDELVDIDAPLATGQIRDSNRWAIAGALAAMGADVVHLRRAGDALDALRDRLAEGLACADAVMLTGGSSVGERDLTPDAIAEFAGPGVIVHGLRVKPGKPTVLAAVGETPVIGLPGNPASALMILEAVCAPIVAQMTGERERRSDSVACIAAEAFAGRAGWTWYIPAEIRMEGGVASARPLALRSAFTSLLARAHGYVVLGEDRPRVEPGETVAVVRFSGGGRP